MSPATSIGLAVVAACATWVATKLALRFLRRRQILDQPNERSSHTRPTPRGLGLGLIPVVLASWVIVSLLDEPPREVWVVAAGAALLAVLSWVDDVRNLPAAPRLLAQVLAAVVGVAVFEGSPIPASWLPPIVGEAFLVLLWVGLINQINFTDGIDGHLGIMVLSTGLGLFAVSLATGALGVVGPLAIVLAGCALGFLPLNWNPAKAFMGDVGSVPLGYIIGWLLLRTAADGHLVIAVILPLFYFVDTAVTYAGRIGRGERFWQPHRKYLYQRAAVALSHARIVKVVALCNAVLIVVAVAASGGRNWLLPCAFLPVVLTYGYLSKHAAPAASKG